MIDIAALIVKIASEQALKNVVKTVFHGNKSDLQKAYRKAFDNAVDFYEYKYGDSYGKKKNRFFNYRENEEQLAKLIFIRQKPDIDFIEEHFELKTGITIPADVLLGFIRKLHYELRQFRECEDILIEKDKYHALMNIDKNTDDMAQNIKRLTNHFVKEEEKEQSKPLFWKDLFEAFKTRQLHVISIKHVGGGLLGPEVLPLEDVFFEQDAGERTLSFRKDTSGRQKGAGDFADLFGEMTVCEGHIWRALQERQINSSQVKQLTSEIDKENIRKIAGEFATKYNERSTVVSNVQFQQIVEQLAKKFELDSIRVIAALSLFFTESMKREPVLEVLKPPCSAFVIGDAGVGKTTVMRMLSLNLFKRCEAGEENVPLPLFVRLDKIENYITEKQCIHEAKNALFAYISDHWKSHLSHESDISATAIEQCELPLQIILDGLDEIPSSNIREKLILAARDLVQQNICNIIITSRPTAVDSTLIKTSQLTEIRLLELTTEQTNAFVDNFFTIYNYPNSGVRDSEKFTSALALSEAAMQFSGNPLYLTVMILMHKKNEVLPKKRLDLYAEFYQMLLLQRARGKFEGKYAEKPMFQLLDEKLIKWGEAVYTPLLQWIAYLTHSSDADSVSIEQKHVIAAIKHEALENEIKQITLTDVAKRFINFADEELGLLVSRGQFYGFSHRSLQEYLAAMHLADFQKQPTIEQFWNNQALKKPDRWMEVSRLLFCKLLDKKFFGNWVRNINDTDDLRVIQLINSIIFDMEEFFPGGGGIQSQKENVLAALKARRNRSHNSPDMFLACSDAIGSMDVPFIDVSDPPLVKLEAEEPFIMGDNNFDQDWAKPEFKATLSTYFIGQYPVTNKEFAAFINDRGYSNERYWYSAHKALDFDGRDFLKKLKRKIPQYWEDDRFGKKRPLTPVVGICWFEALAYCLWWNEKYGKLWAEKHNCDDVLVRLPTEAEWEYACRAGTKTPFNTGENLTTDQANYHGNYPYKDFPKGTYLAKTTTVGSYPPNDWKLFDMHGNVWEWCLDWYDGNFYEKCQKAEPVVNPINAVQGSGRVLRGGGWDDCALICRSAFRNGNYPDDRLSIIGFRLVFVPQSVGSSSDLPMS